MENILIAIIGEDSDASEMLFKGFKKFTPSKVVLLVKKKYEKKINSIEKELSKFGISSEHYLVSDFLHMEEVFMKIKDMSNLYSKDNIVINVDTDYMSSCLALSSAFVNGIAAIGVLKDEIIAYPIMKFSYYNAINEKKRFILETISKYQEIESMEKLSKLTKMSLPLIAYHLKGNRDSKGLIEMNLVEAQRKEGSISLKLTELGRLIVGGYIDFNCNVKNNKKKKI